MRRGRFDPATAPGPGSRERRANHCATPDDCMYSNPGLEGVPALLARAPARAGPTDSNPAALGPRARAELPMVRVYVR